MSAMGSNSEVGGRNREVRCAPVNGHRQAEVSCLKGAISDQSGILTSMVNAEH
jgi:hypothetical protein